MTESNAVWKVSADFFAFQAVQRSRLSCLTALIWNLNPILPKEGEGEKKQKKKQAQLFKETDFIHKNSLTINPEATLSVCLQINPMHLYMLFRLFYSLKRVKCSFLLSAYNPARVWRWRVRCVHCSAVSLGNGADSHLSVCLARRPSASSDPIGVSHLLMKS